VAFNLIKPNISKHTKRMMRIKEKIATSGIENVIILISTHSDKGSGRPFFELHGSTEFDEVCNIELVPSNVSHFLSYSFLKPSSPYPS